MKRIEPEKVPDVFRRLDLNPVVGTFVGDIGQRQCCILSAIYCDATGCGDPMECLGDIRSRQIDEDSWYMFADSLGIDAEYARGVAMGWDEGISLGPPSDGDPAEHGHHDGVAARKAVEAAGMLVMGDADDDDEYDGDEDDWDDDSEWDELDCDERDDDDFDENDDFEDFDDDDDDDDLD